MRRILLLVMMVGTGLGGITDVQACSCMDAGSFFTIAEKAAWQPGVLIVRAEVRDHEAHGMDVKILEVLNGSEEKSVVRVWGDPGFMCRLYTNGFKKGDRLVLILDRIENAYYQDERNGDYQLNGCGTYVVREDQRISGRIMSSDKEMSKTKFFNELEQIMGKHQPDLAKIYPVPADKLLTISVPDLPYSTLSVRIITLAGQPLQTRQLEVGKQHQIDVSTLAKGVYIILFRTEHQFYTRRFIKQ
ncbi:T9SS type A sorting domain-containing protein [Larkinella sp. GY13]|uniref:T9SS type A sorting domain-containing protein n=1 Tax=Larkinella sp. GY13 TaxID=3453720 RepID=UPI003EECBAAB